MRKHAIYLNKSYLQVLKRITTVVQVQIKRIVKNLINHNNRNRRKSNLLIIKNKRKIIILKISVMIKTSYPIMTKNQNQKNHKSMMILNKNN